MKKSKLKIQNIIIVINTIILLGIIGFYGYRLIHFYKIEHPKVDETFNLVQTITLEKNITTIDDGLYETDDGFIFKGKNVNNYLEYSGYLFRIISIDKNNNIKLITEESLTNLAWGIENNYDKSYIKSWLNSEEKHKGIFYKSLNNAYLVDTNFCIEKVNEESKKCTEITTDKVGLMSLEEYNNAGGTKSYLQTNNTWWLSNPSEEGIWYVYSNGNINDVIKTGKNYYSYGVRPVITIKGDIALISGDGSVDNPYKVENESANVLKNKNVGKYIKYSDLTWRIIEKNDNYIRVTLDGVLKENEEDLITNFSSYSNVYATNNGIGKYLNNDFYNTLDNTYMVDGTVYVNRYDSTVDFDYNGIFETSITAKVGMMQVGDLFMNDYTDYYLVSRTSTYVGTVYKVIENNGLYADLPTEKAKIRPTIFLNLESPIISGDGTQNNPYVIGDNNE